MTMTTMTKIVVDVSNVVVEMNKYPMVLIVGVFSTNDEHRFHNVFVFSFSNRNHYRWLLMMFDCDNTDRMTNHAENIVWLMMNDEKISNVCNRFLSKMNVVDDVCVFSFSLMMTNVSQAKYFRVDGGNTMNDVNWLKST